MYRGELTKKYAWAIPTAEALNKIKEYSPIVEICAGTGYWASLLAAMGVDITCYDTNPHQNDWCNGNFHPVNLGSYEEIVDNPTRTLFLCWPPYESDKEIAEGLQYYKKDTILYVGEQCGCTGNLPEEWEEQEYIRIPQWDGIHDALYVFTRKKGN